MIQDAEYIQLYSCCILLSSALKLDSVMNDGVEQPQDGTLLYLHQFSLRLEPHLRHRLPPVLIMH